MREHTDICGLGSNDPIMDVLVVEANTSSTIINMSHEERKIERLNVIRRSIEKAKNPNYELLIATGIVEWGCSRRTMLEYINSVLLYLKKEIYKK